MKPRILLVIILTLLFIPLTVFAKKPPITWTPKAVNQTMGLMDSDTVSVVLSSNEDLGLVDLWVVPELQPFISVSPSVLDISAGIPYTVSVSCTIPPGTPTEMYDGTIHVRSGSSTIPATLKVEIGFIFAAAAEVGPGAAIVEVTDPASELFGVRLEIPENALTNETIITIKKSDINIQSSDKLDTVLVAPPIEILSGNTELNEPCTIIIPYHDLDNDGFLDGSDFSEKYIHVYYLPNQNTVEFMPVDNFNIDTQNNFISIYTNHFSVFDTEAYRWETPNNPTILDYYISENTIPNYINRSTLINELKEALYQWSKAMDYTIRFIGTNDHNEAEFIFEFGNFCSNYFSPEQVQEWCEGSPLGSTMLGVSIRFPDQFKIYFNVIDGNGSAANWIVENYCGTEFCIDPESTNRPFLRVALHEIGHALGLERENHENEPKNTCDDSHTTCQPSCTLDNRVVMKLDERIDENESIECMHPFTQLSCIDVNNIREHYNLEQQDNEDSDALGDLCDNCPNTPNPDQADFDGDGIGNVCEIVSYNFSGWIGSKPQDPQNYFQGTIKQFDRFNGTFTYDLQLVDEDWRIQRGFYPFDSPPSGISVTINGINFSTAYGDPLNWSWVLVQDNFQPVNDIDSLSIISTNTSFQNIPVIPETDRIDLNVRFYDPTRTALSNDDLPTNISLDTWPQRYVGISGVNWNDSSKNFQIQGVIDTLVPNNANTPTGFISIDDPVFGPGSITRDTETNIDWLDLTVSMGYSYQEMMEELNAGGIFEDYRLATSDEVNELWIHVGLPGFIGQVDSEEFYEPIRDFQSLFGVTNRTEMYGTINESSRGYCVPISSAYESQTYLLYTVYPSEFGGMRVGYNSHLQNPIPVAGGYLVKK